MKRTITIVLIIFFILVIIIPSVQAEEKSKELYFFYGEGCPHCAREHQFLDNLEKKYPQLKIERFEVWSNKENADLLEKMAEDYELKLSGVPVTFIGEKFFVGYRDDKTTGREMELAVQKVLELNGRESSKTKENFSKKIIDYPLIGSLNLSGLSLPVLTLVLGLLDGFNPCAMWVLLFLLALLVNTKSRKKMWLVGGTFILTSGIVYYLFIAAWLNFFLFVGYLSLVRLAIGLVAIAGGIIHLKDFFKYKEGECKIEKGESRLKLVDRIKKLTQNKILPATILGIIALAFSVNLIELFCSAGLPAIYTEILALSNLGTPTYYLYLLLYVLFYMLDDLIVFIIAVVALNAVGFTGKFSRFSNLIGGILILILGLLLIFAPEILMFG